MCFNIQLWVPPSPQYPGSERVNQSEDETDMEMTFHHQIHKKVLLFNFVKYSKLFLGPGCPINITIISPCQSYQALANYRTFQEPAKSGESELIERYFLCIIKYGWCYLSDRGPTNNLLFVGRGPTNNLIFVVLANIHFDKIELEQIYALRRHRARKGNQRNS